MTRSNQIDQGNFVVDDAYRDVVERINNQDPRRQRLAKDTLSWVICAKRPLTTLELRTALTIELGQTDLNDEDLYDLEDIIASCAGLITVGSDGTKEVVQLAHYTMQEYFTRNQAEIFPEAEKDITASCLTYLSYTTFCQGMCHDDIKFEARLSRYPFYSYAARNWGNHARVHSTIDNLSLWFLNNTCVVEASVQALFSVKGYFGLQSYCLRVPFGFTALHLTAWFGLEELSRIFIQRGMMWTRDSVNRDPLAWAALNGQTSVVKMLLDHGVSPLQFDEDGQTPISLAAWNGHTETVKLLLDYNVDPNPNEIGECAPLTKASYRGHHETVKLLLERGAQPEPNNNHEKTPFIWACYNGSIEIVRTLLDHSNGRLGGFGDDYCIDFGRKDAQGNTAASYALDHGHYDIIQLLRERGILPEKSAHIDDLFNDWSSNDNGDNVTATRPHIGPAVGWPFMEAQMVSRTIWNPQELSFKCQLCPKGPFGNVGSLLRHFQGAHCPETAYKCGYPSCGKSFGRRDKASEHCRASHGGIYEETLCFRQGLDPPPRCLICQIPLSSRHALRRCIVRHSKQDNLDFY